MKKISTEFLAELLRANYKLMLLEKGGVGNWEGYDSSLSCVYDAYSTPYYEYEEKSDEELTSNYEDAE